MKKFLVLCGSLSLNSKAIKSGIVKLPDDEAQGVMLLLFRLGLAHLRSPLKLYITLDNQTRLAISAKSLAGLTIILQVKYIKLDYTLPGYKALGSDHKPAGSSFKVVLICGETYCDCKLCEIFCIIERQNDYTTNFDCLVHIILSYSSYQVRCFKKWSERHVLITNYIFEYFMGLYIFKKLDSPTTPSKNIHIKMKAMFNNTIKWKRTSSSKSCVPVDTASLASLLGGESSIALSRGESEEEDFPPPITNGKHPQSNRPSPPPNENPINLFQKAVERHFQLGELGEKGIKKVCVPHLSAVFLVQGVFSVSIRGCVVAPPYFHCKKRDVGVLQESLGQVQCCKVKATYRTSSRQRSERVTSAVRSE
ncbi:hypothetical protein C0J52_14098 [Blattella germanica]|nr:hypothetical protein C0J52_14098 [Blattella germanica]